MNEEFTSFSACSARLMGSFISLKFSLSCISQITPSETSGWAARLEKNVGNKLSDLGVHGRIKGALENGEFATEYIKFSALTNAIMSFSSTTEYFIKDIIQLCLQRSSKLRMHAFSQFEISALMLENNKSIDEIKLHLVQRLSSTYSKGGSFKDKITKASTFLILDNGWQEKQLFKALDSIFTMRNHIAHNNTDFLETIELQSNEGPLSIKRSSSSEEFTNFTIKFVEILNEAYAYLIKWDKQCLIRWNADNFIARK